MKIFIICFKLLMNFIYSFFKLLKTKNKVTFISRQSDDINIDFKLLAEEIKKEQPDVEIVMLTKMLKNKINYFFHMFVQMYHIATSKVVVLDTYCIMISVLKHKKELKVIQIWHALGSLKKFGYSSLDKRDGRNSRLAEEMNMHKNYTYVLTSSETSKPFFQEAFNAKDEQMKVMSIPRVDFLQSEIYKKKMSEKFYDFYPEANNQKENILYCPTKRKDNSIHIDMLIKDIDFDRYNFIVELHDGQQFIYVNEKKIEKDTNFTGMELLHVADYIITDYSAIVYEAAIVEKPIYFYDYDYDTYMNDRGWYIDYQNEMPGPIEKDFKKIIRQIEDKQWNKQKVIDFRNKYIEDLSSNVTKKIVKLMFQQKDE